MNKFRESVGELVLFKKKNPQLSKCVLFVFDFDKEKTDKIVFENKDKNQFIWWFLFLNHFPKFRNQFEKFFSEQILLISNFNSNFNSSSIKS